MAKALTREHLEARKAKAVRFLRDVLDDPVRAEEVEAESVEDYDARRRIKIAPEENPITVRLHNPRCQLNIFNTPRREPTMTSKAELERQIRELEQENDELRDQLDEIADIAAPEEETNGEDEENESGEA